MISTVAWVLIPAGILCYMLVLSPVRRWCAGMVARAGGYFYGPATATPAATVVPSGAPAAPAESDVGAPSGETAAAADAQAAAGALGIDLGLLAQATGRRAESRQ